MKFATIREMKTQFSAYIKAVRKGEIVVTKNGKPVALLSPLSEEDFEDCLLEHNPLFMRAIENRWRQYSNTGRRRPRSS